MERRTHFRHPVRTVAYVFVTGERGRRCTISNLSASGVFVENLFLPEGMSVELAFAVNLGHVTRIHRRRAVVTHISAEGAGMRMHPTSRRQARAAAG